MEHRNKRRDYTHWNVAQICVWRALAFHLWGAAAANAAKPPTAYQLQYCTTSTYISTPNDYRSATSQNTRIWDALVDAKHCGHVSIYVCIWSPWSHVAPYDWRLPCCWHAWWAVWTNGWHKQSLSAQLRYYLRRMWVCTKPRRLNSSADAVIGDETAAWRAWRSDTYKSHLIN